MGRKVFIKTFSSQEINISGMMYLIELSELLEKTHLKKQSLTIKIENKNTIGCIYFYRGRIVHARYNRFEGIKAFKKIITENNGKLSKIKLKKDVKITINMSFNKLIKKTINSIDKKSINNNLNYKKKEEKEMNVKKLNESIEILKNDLGQGLLSSDIFESNEGQSIAGYNSNSKACALFNRITKSMDKALSNSGFSNLGKYYMLDLEDDKMVVILLIENFQWGMLLDRNKVKMGLLLNIVIPEILDSLKKAIS